MYAVRSTVTVTTDASGVGEGFTVHLNGRIHQIRYVKVDFENGVDFTITNEATGETIWAENNVDASKTVAPRQPTSTTAGAAAVYTDDDKPVLDHIVVAGDRIKIAVASGGNAKSGVFHVVAG